MAVLFLVTQTHTLDVCPMDVGGREAPHAKPEDVPGLKTVAAYGAYAEHLLYLLRRRS